MEPVSQTIESRWPKSLLEILEVAIDALKLAGRPDGEATEHAEIVVRAIANYHGGRQFYLPLGKALDVALKHAQIWREFNGRNVLDLSRKHGMSEQSIYRVLARQREIRRVPD